MNTSPKFNAAARHKARRFALQALYQWQLAQHSTTELAAQYAEERLMPKADQHYFNELILQIPPRAAALDALFADLLEQRTLAEIDPIELAILRIATYELQQRLEIPYRVVINEAVELAKEFGADESYKYINGVINHCARALRTLEFQN